MTAIVIPLVRATASPWENVEQTAAELCSKGAGESAAPTQTVATEALPTQTVPNETFPAKTLGAETLATETLTTPEDPLAEDSLAEDSPPETPSSDPDLWLYRDRTVGLLRRYVRLSVEVGRLPSLLGREFFRTRVTSYSATTFEDAVIFVHDVKRCLEKLDEFENKLIAKIVFQDYTQDEAAVRLGCWRRTVGRRFPETLDRLSEIFLQSELLERLPAISAEPLETCQEGKTGEIFVSDCEQRK